MLETLVLGLLTLGLADSPSNLPKPIEPRIRDASDAYFAAGPVTRVRIKVAPDELAKLKANPREYVKASFQEDDGPVVPEIAIKLKGAAGSFRQWDERPALTLNLRKFDKQRTFHDLRKIHLNNSVQDETYLNEILSADLFLRAGVPAARVAHARVWLNDRDVGIYVLKEGFDELFLRRWFENPKGNLYDGGFLQDLDAALEKDEGDGPDDRRDLKAIVTAARSDPAQRAKRLEALVDLDSFCSFMAVERLIGHWDGYVDKANNYRLYIDPARNKAVFLPHGMDQVFWDPDGNLLAKSDRIVGGVIKQDLTLWKRYQDRVERLLPLVAPADDLIRRLDEIDRRIRPAIEAADPGLASRRAQNVAGMKERLVARAVSLQRQVAEAKELGVAFDAQGVARLDGWQTLVKAGTPTFDEAEMKPGVKALRIQANGNEAVDASYRRRLALEAGRYTLKTEAQAEKVVPWAQPNGGVGVRISGVNRGRHLTGNVARSPVNYSFQVTDAEQVVELVLELRAQSGQVWFRRDSLQLVREKPRAGR